MSFIIPFLHLVCSLYISAFLHNQGIYSLFLSQAFSFLNYPFCFFFFLYTKGEIFCTSFSSTQMFPTNSKSSRFPCNRISLLDSQMSKHDVVVVVKGQVSRQYKFAHFTQLCHHTMSWKFSSTKALVKLSCFSSKNLKISQDSWCVINHQLLGEVWVCFFWRHLSCSILRDFTLVFLQCFFFLLVDCMCNHYLQNIFLKKKNCVVCVLPL